MSPEPDKTESQQSAQEALAQAIACYNRHDGFNARQWAIRAALLNPGLETPWLLLAAVVQPAFAFPYLEKVLTINPQNQRAKQGLAWARQHTQPIEESTNQEDVLSHPPNQKRRAVFVQLLLSRSVSSLLILLTIAFLTLLGIQMASQGTQRLSIDFGQAVLDAFRATLQYIFNHPPTYYWHKADVPAIQVVLELFLHSTGLLLFSLLIASSVGILFGILAALIRSKQAKPAILFLSILGISTPSFLLAMLLRILNVQVYTLFDLSHAILPPSGFGWDGHIIMPAIVLAARPLAQIMQVTYVSMQEVLAQDYIRAAKARGASLKILIKDHALKNILIPVLTTIGTSLRFSLASLPVVEVFFVWTGIGTAVLDAIENQVPTLITDLMVSLGLLFLLVNLIIELLYPRIDPRLQFAATPENEGDIHESGNTPLTQMVREIIAQTKEIFSRQKKNQGNANSTSISPISTKSWHEKKTIEPAVGFLGLDSRRIKIIRNGLSNRTLMFGGLLVLGFFLLALFGKSWAPLHPFETHSIMTIEGVIQAPPFAPSSMFQVGFGSHWQGCAIAHLERCAADFCPGSFWHDRQDDPGGNDRDDCRMVAKQLAG